MNHSEETVVFPCEGETLVGILSKPEMPAQTGVVVIVGGPQYRAGSHRQFVLLSRALAAAGYAVLRFDYRGMGDSTGTSRSFEEVNVDVASAISALQTAVSGVRNIVLWGLCDGASAALLYCHATQDVRVRGLCLLNPWVRSAASLAKTHVKHYYFQRLKQKEFWIKLLSGQVAGEALRGLLRNIKLSQSGHNAHPATAQLPFQDRMAQAWKLFDGNILLWLSGDDYTAREFADHVGTSATWVGALQKNRLIQHHEPDADHTLSNTKFNVVIEKSTLDLLAKLEHQ